MCLIFLCSLKIPTLGIIVIAANLIHISTKLCSTYTCECMYVYMHMHIVDQHICYAECGKFYEAIAHREHKQILMMTKSWAKINNYYHFIIPYFSTCTIRLLYHRLMFLPFVQLQNNKIHSFVSLLSNQIRSIRCNAPISQMVLWNYLFAISNPVVKRFFYEREIEK